MKKAVLPTLAALILNASLAASVNCQASNFSCAMENSTCYGGNFINLSECPGYQDPANSPLSPLNCDEIACVTDAVKSDPNFTAISDAIFVQVLLKEPPKSYVLAWYPALPLNRQAEVILYRNCNNESYKVIVNLPEPNDSGCTVASFKKLDIVGCPGMNWHNPPQDNDWFSTAQVTQVCLNNDKLMKALKKRGVTRQMVEDGTVVPNMFYSFESFRKFKGERDCPDLIDHDAPNYRYYPCVFSNYAVNPGEVCIPTANWAMVEGLYAIFDVNNKKIVKIIDEYVAPKNELPYPQAVDDPYPLIDHPPMKPLCVSMPEGASFSVDNRVVRWDNWEFEFSWQRSGLTLYNVSYTENGQKRSILYKAAATEAMVTYNAEIPTPARDYISGDAFDYPILLRLAPLVKGRDIPAYAETHDISVSDCCGNPWVIKDAIGIYEQESDLLWRVNEGVVHEGWPSSCVDPVTGARKRQLVVRSIFSGFYYLWIFSYVFNQDGSIEVYADLGGQTTDDWVKPNSESPWGELIAKQYIALNHTHNLVYRLDFDIDGQNNSVVEEDIYHSYSNKKNSCGDAVDVSEKVLKTEKDAVRDLDPTKNRVFQVINPNSFNRLGHPRGYELIPYSPLGNGTSETLRSSIASRHYGVLNHHVHVTRYHDDEQYGTGEFPVLADRPTGMEEYIANNENIQNKDIVFWYTMNWAHTPDTEDYPFISVLRQGFKLEPHNFFGMNPAVSVVGQTLEGPEECCGELPCSCSATTTLQSPIPCECPG